MIHNPGDDMRELTEDVARKGQLESLFTEQRNGSVRDSDIVVSIVMESQEQLAFMQSASDLLCDLEISHEVVVMSNYTQERVVEFTRIAQLRGLKVVIAGGAPGSDFFSSITSNTLLPVLEVAISAPQIGENPPASDPGEVNTFPNDRVSQVRSLAQKAARTAAAIAALDDCHISERLRTWQEMQTKTSDAKLTGQ
jgi:phosphoribosylcarboxyaminoimidazole (NCAIR) mutase